MKLFAVLLLSSSFALAQATPEDHVKQLEQENAMLRIQVTGLQNALLQAQVQDATKKLSEAHEKAVHDLEALNPGKKWDEQQGKLVERVGSGKAK